MSNITAAKALASFMYSKFYRDKVYSFIHFVLSTLFRNGADIHIS